MSTDIIARGMATNALKTTEFMDSNLMLLSQNISNLTDAFISAGIIVTGTTPGSGGLNELYPLIESLVLDKSVSSIPDDSFNGWSDLKKISILSGITSIGNNSFKDCSSLEKIIFCRGISSIGVNSFSGCTSLSKIVCPGIVPPTSELNSFEGVNTDCLICIPIGSTENYNHSIGWVNFTNLKEGIVVYPSELKDIIGNDNLLSITGLTLVGIINGDDITTLNKMSSEGLLSVLDLRYVDIDQGGKFNIQAGNNWNPITIPVEGKVNNIIYAGFKNCTGLTSVILPDSIVSIDNQAFYGCSELNNISISNNVNSIGSYCFYNCGKLSDIIISSNIKVISDYLFGNCNNLSGVTISDGIISIGESL